MHLFLWRDMDTNVQADTHAITTVNMGNRPSSTIAQAALKKTADRESDTYPEEARVVQDNSYMNDILGSADSQEESVKLTKNIDGKGVSGLREVNKVFEKKSSSSACEGWNDRISYPQMKIWKLHMYCNFLET